MAKAKRERHKQARELRRKAEQAAAKRRQTRQSLLMALLVTALLILGYNVFFAGDGDEKATTTTVAQACPPVDGSGNPVLSFAAAPPQCTSPDKKYTAVFDTSEGLIEVELQTTDRPTTVNNFVFLARHKYYDGNKVFRLAESIDIWQSGSPHSQDASDEGPGYRIPDEGKDFTYAPGDLVMARDDEGGAAQYFFVTGPDGVNLSPPLGAGTYVPFGKTVKGLDVVQKIMGLHGPDPGNSYEGPPNKEVIIRSVTIRES